MSLTKIVLLLALSFFAAVLILALNGEVRVEHDSGVYIALGKSLATGQGYRAIFLAGIHPTPSILPCFPPSWPPGLSRRYQSVTTPLLFP